MQAPSLYLSPVFYLGDVISLAVEVAYYFALTLGIATFWRSRRRSRVKILAMALVFLALLHLGAPVVATIQIGRGYRAWMEHKESETRDPKDSR